MSGRARTSFEQLCADRKALSELKARLVRCTHPWRRAHAEDDVAQAFVRAMEREAHGEHWDAAKESAFDYFSKIISCFEGNARTRLDRAPGFSALLETDDFASDAPDAERQLLEAEAHAASQERAREFHEKLLRESQTGLSPRVYEAIRAGVSGHAALAEHLGCERDAVRLAVDRIRKRAERQRKRDADKSESPDKSEEAR